MYKLFDIANVPRISGVQELYFRKKNNSIFFDTYYNVIPVRKLKKYTTITELVFSQNVEIYSEHGRLSEGNRIAVDDVPEDAEILYISADCDNSSEITVFAEGKQRYTKPALIICTFKREKQVKENIDYLLENITDNEIEIILVDNDSSIPKDNWESENITVLHNVNNGGSGGYSSGMKYAAVQNRFTHVILMDDDAVIDYTALQKMKGIISFLKDEYDDLSIAGSMLFNDNPCVQFECGGYFSQDGIQIGHGYHSDLTDQQQLVENEREKRINYGGWWLMCMPLHYIAEGQYPAPFFIKYDDVEYSLRCNLKIITLNGFGVWHDNFGGKYNSVQEYFNTRNYLFVMKRHSQNFTDKKAYKKARYLLLEKICRQQYKMADAVLLAYRDYLKGDEYLESADYGSIFAELEKLNYQMLSKAEIKSRYNIDFDRKLYDECSSRKFRKYMQPLMYGHLIPGIFCRKITITDVLSDRKEHYFRADRVLHYDLSSETGYVTEKSLTKAVRLIFGINNLFKRFSEEKK